MSGHPPKTPKTRRRAPGFRVRTLTRSGRAVRIALRRELWPEHSREYLEQDADALLRSRKRHPLWRASMGTTVLLAELRSGPVVGFREAGRRPFADGCRTSPVGNLEAYDVRPEHRRSRIGRALVRAAEEWAREHGGTERASDTEVLNVPSHRALGYREVDRLVHFRHDLGPRPRRARRTDRAP